MHIRTALLCFSLCLTGVASTARAESAFSTATPKFTCADNVTAVQGSGAPGVTASGTTYYVGTHQATGINQNSIVRAFGTHTWCRDTYETIGADGAGLGLLLDGVDLYVVFSINGGATPSRTICAASPATAGSTATAAAAARCR